MSKDINIEFQKEHFNDWQIPLLYDENRVLNLPGGAGSAKSWFACHKKMVRMLNEPNHRFIFTRKVHRTIRNSQYQLFKDMAALYGLTQLFEFRDSILDIQCPRTNSKVICVGMDDPEKLKSIAGITGAWVEEATEFTHNDFMQLNLRLRGVTEFYKQIILTYNTIDEFHWLKKNMIDNEYPNCTTKVTTYLDNKFLDKEYIETLLQLQNEDETYWKIYGLGQWATAKGLCYTNWGIVNEFPDFEQSINTCYGLDFGFNNPSTLTQCSYHDNELWWKEMFYETKLNTSDVIDKIKALEIGNSVVYCDHDPEKISEMRKAGINAKKANKKSKYNGIMYCKRFKINVLSESTNGIKETRAYKWKEDKNGDPTDEPVDFMNHFMDACRYGTFTHGVKYWRPEGTVKKSSRIRKPKVDKYRGYK